MPEKPVSEFYKQSWSYSSWCKECFRERSRQQVKTGENRRYKQNAAEDDNAKARAKRAANGAKPRTRMKLSILERAAKISYDNAYKRALRNGKEFDLTPSWVIEKFEEFCRGNHHGFENNDPFKPSLDRIDNSRGYMRDNVRVVWLIENYCRNTYSEDQVVEFCRRKLGLPPDDSNKDETKD